ncbi:FadR family transcriptional regulator [Planosporangium flavigriseum]|uniref:GntR family transcriptional regulator n=1 Tax=Planosporangium flavigriseum TaxID=373681 RepID=A0A8J3M1J8_9ACTN|nr:FadR/GntR family transcriptional regulator [Planosporangium flavigriseum]NJC65533.1 FadR family transcriptional regulator [Planosporangium flavigriseum]GIG75030.1 GntR family transcriptional regulator [Planosporangium flavigriseum]
MSRVVASITLTQGVAEHLRSLIHRGEVGPGDRLPPERVLAEQLGVARMSLRDAIKILQDDGYVEARRGAGGGTFVTELQRPVETWRARMREQVGEFDDIIDYRIALEAHTARLAAARRTQSDLAALRAAIKSLGRGRGVAAFRQADSRFHDALARSAGNARLQTAIHSARGELFTPHDFLMHEGPVEQSRQDHQAIYVAIREGDPDAAESLMRTHIERTRLQLREIVFGRDDSA